MNIRRNRKTQNRKRRRGLIRNRRVKQKVRQREVTLLLVRSVLPITTLTAAAQRKMMLQDSRERGSALITSSHAFSGMDILRRSHPTSSSGNSCLTSDFPTLTCRGSCNVTKNKEKIYKK